jgi:hypothetical protein
MIYRTRGEHVKRFTMIKHLSFISLFYNILSLQIIIPCLSIDFFVFYIALSEILDLNIDVGISMVKDLPSSIVPNGPS